MDQTEKTIFIAQKDLNAIRSGVPRKVLEETKYFVSRGHKVFLVAEKFNDNFYTNAGANLLKVFRWPVSGYFRRKFYMRRFRKLTKKHKPDLVIGHGDVVEQDIAYIHNCVHLANELIYKKPLPDNDQMAKVHSEILSKQKFKLLVCNSNLMKNDLCKRFNIPKSKACVIYPEYSKKKFFIPSSSYIRDEYRRKYNIDGKIVIGLITSGNFKKRNVQLLVDSLKVLDADFLDKIHIVVAGKDNPERYREQLRKNNHEQYFTFLPSIDNVENYFHMIDIFVLPAFIEEFGRSVLEAMACGKSVIVSKTVGASEILEGESREFILNELTTRKFVEKLQILVSNPDLRESLGKLNYQTALNYSSKEQTDKFHDLLGTIGQQF